MTMSKKSLPLTVNLDTELRAKLEQLAERAGSSLDSVLHDVLAQYFEPGIDEAWNDVIEAKVQRGRAAYAAGNFVEHERVGAWLDDLGNGVLTPAPRAR